ncbi:MAG: RimK family protein [Thiobacillus sp.]|uniref:RimK family protein n=1 Tax=Thiobacillus sp. TaxID=924 RepID=UPI002895FD11|nr:RimK family protein [Thiobacillus sp.]MDT3706395.1 RimK family protein [Thiobacillus sp.]
MSILIVVDNPRDWPLDIPGVSVVSARAYLTDPAFGEDHSVKAFNLCRSYRYQSLGYYVSLLAEARGHKPLPRVSTMEDLQSQNMVRLLTEDLDELVQRSLASIKSDDFELSIYFGRNVASRHDALSHQLFSRLQAPLLRAHFERRCGRWHLRSVRAIAASDIPPPHHDFVVEAATAYFMGHRRPAHRRPAPRFDLAILHNPDDAEPPSNARAMQLFEKAATEVGLAVEFITRADLGRLPQFDALFIRDTTYPNHYTYRFSRRAAAEGLVVIDDPDSILRCNNKVYLAELLARHNIPAPRTLMVHQGNLDQIIPGLGLPCVLKQPDSSGSLGVARLESEPELAAKVGALLQKSELIVAQEWLPTEFDWRVGILDRRPLFVCRYYMAKDHWQIVKREAGRHGYEEGPVQAMAVAEAPEEVVKLALKAANLIGDGLYGVDIKQVGSRCHVIEINDNPNIDAGNEDGVLKDALYREIIGSFVRRIEARKRVNA